MSRALPDDEHVRQLAGEILRRPEYAQWRSLHEDGWLGGLGSRIGAAVDWLLELPARQPALSWAFEAALLAFAAALLAHVALSVRAALNASAASVPTPEAPPPPDWLAQADRDAGGGRFLEAAHTLQLATLEVLLRSGRLQLARSEPNRVLRRRLGEAPLEAGLRARLLDLVARLEAAWFRDGAADAELYRDWRALFGAVRREG